MRHERVNVHPLVNTRTTGLASADLIKFLESTGHPPVVIALSTAEGVD
jgi:Ala-tRNA(Pro) deacylase